MPTTSAVRVASWGVLAVVVAAVTACGSSAAPVDDSAAPRPVGPAAVQVAVNPNRQAVLNAYAGYLNAETLAAQQADFGSAELTRFMDQPLLGQWVSQLYHLHAIGYQQRGAVVSAAPKLTSLTVVTSKGTGTATVTDCLDETAMTIVKASNGEPMKLPQHNSRYQTTATLHLADGMWRVYEVDADRSRTC